MGAQKADYRVKDIYQEENPDVEYGVFSNFITECNHFLMQEVILNNLSIKLPSMGSLYIKKFRPKVIDEEGNLIKKGLKVDFHKTRQLWATKYPGMKMAEVKQIADRPMVYYTNKHSDGYVFKFKWDTLTSSLPGKSCYTFRPARQHGRFLATCAKNPDITIDFYEKK